MLPPLYDPEAVKPMWQELAAIGIQPLRTPEEVHDIMAHKEGTTLVVVNSVCGCAAGAARPGVSLSLQHSVIPDRFVTVFAGVDRDAVNAAREYMSGVQPSSPCIALFKDGRLAAMLERRHIEMMNAPMLAGALADAYEKFCSRQGPSVPREMFESVVRATQCGSTIPTFNADAPVQNNLHNHR